MGHRQHAADVSARRGLCAPSSGVSSDHFCFVPQACLNAGFPLATSRYCCYDHGSRCRSSGHLHLPHCWGTPPSRQPAFAALELNFPPVVETTILPERGRCSFFAAAGFVLETELRHQRPSAKKSNGAIWVPVPFRLEKIWDPAVAHPILRVAGRETSHAASWCCQFSKYTYDTVRPSSCHEWLALGILCS